MIAKMQGEKLLRETLGNCIPKMDSFIDPPCSFPVIYCMNGDCNQFQVLQ